MRLDTAEYAFPVTFRCEGLHVSTYEWRSRPESATAQRRKELKILIKKAFDLSDATYGYRRAHAQLQRWDVAVGLELVRDLRRGADALAWTMSDQGRSDGHPGSVRGDLKITASRTRADGPGARGARASPVPREECRT
jgi:hypothetical protein